MIGLDGSGEVNIGNSLSGVVIASNSGETIGGNAGGARNVISGNYPTNVYLDDATNVLISGNLIGTDARGTDGGVLVPRVGRRLGPRQLGHHHRRSERTGPQRHLGQ